ncbi:MAG TPA: TIGR04283 family arsenosugar biosynthesis glycosyltransferase [Thermoanaerobaculia bacterium]|nr:TIGR04283 family arsenosugar biosynthesis glycosyltransferase [Thermoanaerobaculia bacterium]
MPSPVSVVIASLNEEMHIAAAIDSAFAAGAAEVIVVDGGSRDDTRAIAASRRARVIECPPMRSRQLNLGAAQAGQPHLIFLHADTQLPPGAAAAVSDALGGGVLFGGFRLTFAERGSGLRVAERLINLRTAITRCPWGDQAQFITRARFLDSGGYREIPLMEDYEMAIRMKRAGRTVILPAAVATSGRRFLEKGIVRTAAINWRIIAAYRMGADPEKLARIYRS